jgi:peptidoglycan/LPS O-acetylase OafA/YrhL
MNVPAATSATPLPTPEQDRLGSTALDQWRGLALVLVLISHGFYFTGRVEGIGRVGVNLFFFISGILVYRSLSRSRAASPWERTRSYWWLRLRRLYPALFAYALAMLPLAWFLQHRPNLPPDSDFGSYLKSLPLALTASINFSSGVPWSLGHLWSIACEMQFYLLAPLIFIAGGAAGWQRNAVFGIMAAILIGLGLAQPFVGAGKYEFEFAVWPMMLGFFCEHKRDRLRRISGIPAALIFRAGIAAGGAGLALMIVSPKMKEAVVAAGTLLLAPCLVAYLSGRPLPGFAGRWLKWLGERTYSIYLWQEPLTICNYLPNLLQPMGALASIAVGGVWFHIFERPFLSASRRKFEAQ